MDINLEKIRALADLALDKNLAELIVTEGDRSVTIKLPGYDVKPVIHTTSGYPAQQAAPTVYTPAAPAPMAELPAVSSRAEEAQAPETAGHTITAPMVGTFYSAPSPDSPAYVQAGQMISKGQVVCIIEAMKMMNELEAEISGKVLRVLVENGQPVEFGQPLLLVEPA